MTVAQLIKRISGLKWQLREGSGLIRCEQGWCPIVAAYNHRKGVRAFLPTTNGDWYGASRALRIPVKVAQAIVRAADNTTASPLRQQLLKLVQ
jgi:hypothetical protein